MPHNNKKIAILGVGRVGKTIALDLSKDHEVLAIDSNENNLKQLKSKSLKAIKENILDSKKLNPHLQNCDVVVIALPGFLAYNVLREIINLGKNIVDISFFPEDPFSLDGPARKKNIRVLIDCGVAPGLSNIILGYHHQRMDIDSYTCYVGGLPKIRIWPYQYKAAWSPIDVIEEYVRPARLVENGQIVTKPALSEPEYISFEDLGTFEAFNTDGLRTLLKTVAIKNIKEKTLRFPGHIEYIQLLKETGFFSKNPINFHGIDISPLEFTSRLLFPHWQLKVGEEEFTIMRIIIEGIENNKNTKYVYDIYDQYDSINNLTSMSRTTGYTCTSIVRLLTEGKIKETGLVAPEFIGKNENNFQEIIHNLKSKNIQIKINKFISSK